MRTFPQGFDFSPVAGVIGSELIDSDPRASAKKAAVRSV
jgi:hypothetical protein